MSVAHLISPGIAIAPRRKRFTRADVSCMTDMGLFDGQRYELIDGDLIDKMGQNPPHTEAIQLLTDWLAFIFGIRRVRTQVPIEAASEDQQRSCPEPDVAVLLERKTEYKIRHPNGSELLLLVEVADSSSLFDLTTKANLYARAAVPEYWVLDVANRWLITHRHPVDGQYHQVTRLGEQETVLLDVASKVVSELLP